MKLYIIAGEASGDLHGSNLIYELKKQNSSIDIRCWGGDLMEKAGGKVIKHYKDLAFMGFIEVVLNLRTILRNIEFCKKDILSFQPDAIVLIDYPGFNLRIAEFAKEKGFKVFYYISPQIWAWKQSRVHKIKACVDKMYTILPFEKEFYNRFDYDVEYVGHPLLDEIEKQKNIVPSRTVLGLSEQPIITLLPGSRKQEITTMLPIMLKACEDIQKEFQIVIAAAPSHDKEFYESIVYNKYVKIVFNKTYDLLKISHAALVTSGTATLETALFKVPQVVCYKGSFLSYHIAKRLIKVNYISLVNLIMNTEIVKELIQNELTIKNLKQELNKIAMDNNHREAMDENYDQLIQILGGPGTSQKVATSMLKTLSQ